MTSATLPPAPAEADDTVLRVENVSVRFGGLLAVDSVSLSVSRGELMGLIGPNGAGKTSFIDAVTGFAPGSGHVELDGRSLSGLAPYERARRGLARTWQSTELFHDLDVRENLTVAARRAGGQAAPELALAELGLEWAADAMPDQLSEGQRKLVGIARALAGSPRIICLDEPAAGLDIAESEELGLRLRALADRGQSTLLIDHDMSLVLTICDRVVALEFGHVIADGTPDEVRRDPRVIAAYLGDSIELGQPAPPGAPAGSAELS